MSWAVKSHSHTNNSNNYLSIDNFFLSLYSKISLYIKFLSKDFKVENADFSLKLIQDFYLNSVAERECQRARKHSSRQSHCNRKAANMLLYFSSFFKVLNRRKIVKFRLDQYITSYSRKKKHKLNLKIKCVSKILKILETLNLKLIVSVKLTFHSLS